MRTNALKQRLREGKPARLIERKPEEEKTFSMLGLLTAKPVLYVCNVEEASADRGNASSERVFERARAQRIRRAQVLDTETCRADEIVYRPIQMAATCKHTPERRHTMLPR